MSTYLAPKEGSTFSTQYMLAEGQIVKLTPFAVVAIEAFAT
jgi:hypothetical protein